MKKLLYILSLLLIAVSAKAQVFSVEAKPQRFQTIAPFTIKYVAGDFVAYRPDVQPNYLSSSIQGSGDIKIALPDTFKVQGNSFDSLLIYANTGSVYLLGENGARLNLLLNGILTEDSIRVTAQNIFLEQENDYLILEFHELVVSPSAQTPIIYQVVLYFNSNEIQFKYQLLPSLPNTNLSSLLALKTFVAISQVDVSHTTDGIFEDFVFAQELEGSTNNFALREGYDDTDNLPDIGFRIFHEQTVISFKPINPGVSGAFVTQNSYQSGSGNSIELGDCLKLLSTFSNPNFDLCIKQNGLLQVGCYTVKNNVLTADKDVANILAGLNSGFYVLEFKIGNQLICLEKHVRE